MVILALCPFSEDPDWRQTSSSHLIIMHTSPFGLHGNPLGQVARVLGIVTGLSQCMFSNQADHNHFTSGFSRSINFILSVFTTQLVISGKRPDDDDNLFETFLENMEIVFV